MMGRIPAFVVSLPEDVERLAAVQRQLNPILFNFIASFGFLGSSLPDPVCLHLTRDPNSVNHKGALGVMFSHLLIWERVALLDDPFALIVEDDVVIQNPGRLAFSQFPEGFDYIFCGDQTASDDRPANIAPFTFIPAAGILPLLEEKPAPGAYCYLLSPAGARRLLDLFKTHLYFGHVDVRMLAYGCHLADLDGFAGPVGLLGELKAIRALVQDQPKLAAYATTSALGIHVGMTSRRAREDALGLTNTSL